MAPAIMKTIVLSAAVAVINAAAIVRAQGDIEAGLDQQYFDCFAESSANPDISTCILGDFLQINQDWNDELKCLAVAPTIGASSACIMNILLDEVSNSTSCIDFQISWSEESGLEKLSYIEALCQGPTEECTNACIEAYKLELEEEVDPTDGPVDELVFGSALLDACEGTEDRIGSCEDVYGSTDISLVNDPETCLAHAEKTGLEAVCKMEYLFGSQDEKCEEFQTAYRSWPQESRDGIIELLCRNTDVANPTECSSICRTRLQSELKGSIDGTLDVPPTPSSATRSTLTLFSVVCMVVAASFSM